MSNTQSFQAPTESIPRRFRMLVNAIDECNLTTIHHHCKQIKALVIAGANTTVVEAEGALHHIDVRAVMRVGALLKVREDLHTELQASSNAWTYHSMAQRDRHNHVKRLFNETSQNITDVVNELIMTRQRRILGQNEEATKEAKLHIEQLVANLSGGYVKAARLDTFNIIACINRGADTNVLKKFSEERHLEWARLLPIMNWQRSTCDHLNRTAELRADTNFPTQRSIQLAAFESSERAERCSVLVDKAISELSAHFIKHQPEDEKTAQSSDAASDVRVLAALILDALRQRSHSALKHAFNTLRRKQLNAVDFLKVVEQLLEHGILHWMVLEMTDLLREHEAAIKNRDFVGKKIGTNPSNDPSFKEAIQEINRIEDGMHRLCINMFSQFNAIEQLKKESTVTSSDTQGQPSAAVDYTKVALQQLDQLMLNIEGEHRISILMDLSIIVDNLQKGADNKTIQARAEEMRLDWDTLTDIMTMQYQRSRYMEQIQADDSKCSTLRDHITEMARSLTQYLVDTANTHIEKAVEMLIKDYRLKKEETMQSENIVKLRRHVRDLVMNLKENDLKAARSVCGRVMSMIGIDTTVEQITAALKEHGLEFSMLDEIRKQNIIINVSMDTLQELGKYKVDTPALTKQANDNLTTATGKIYGILDQAANKLNQADRQQRELHREISAKLSALADNLKRNCRHLATLDIFSLLDTIRQGADVNFARTIAEQYGISYPLLEKIDSQLQIARDHSSKIAFMTGVPGHEHDANAVARIGHVRALLDSVTARIAEAVEALIHPHQPKKKEPVKSINPTPVEAAKAILRDIRNAILNHDLTALYPACRTLAKSKEHHTPELHEYAESLGLTMLDAVGIGDYVDDRRRISNEIKNLRTRSVSLCCAVADRQRDLEASLATYNRIIDKAIGRLRERVEAKSTENRAKQAGIDKNAELVKSISTQAEQLNQALNSKDAASVRRICVTLGSLSKQLGGTTAEAAALLKFGIPYDKVEAVQAAVSLILENKAAIMEITFYNAPSQTFKNEAAEELVHRYEKVLSQIVDSMIDAHQPKKEESMKQETIATITAAPGHTLEQVSATQVDVKKEVQLTQVEIIIDASKAKPIELRTRFNRIVETAKMIRGALSGTAMNALIGDLDFIYSGIGPKWDLAEVVRVFGEKGIGENDVMAWVRAEGHHLFWTADGDKLNAKKYEICVVEMVQQFVDTIREKAGLRKLVVKWVHNDTKQDGADVAYRVERDMKASAYALNIYLEQGQNSLAVKSCVDIAQAILLYPGVEEFARGQLELYGVSLEKVVEVTEALAGSKDGDLAEAIKVLKTLKPAKKFTSSWIAMMPTGMPVQDGYRPGEIYMVGAQHAAPMAPACVTWEQLEKMLHSKPSTFPPKKEEPVKSGEMMPELKIPGELSNLTWAYKSVLCQSGLFSAQSTDMAKTALGLVRNGLTKKDWTREQVLQAFLKEGVPTSTTCAWLNAEATYDLARPYVQLMESKGVGHPEAQSGMIRSIQEQKEIYEKAIWVFIRESSEQFNAAVKQ